MKLPAAHVVGLSARHPTHRQKEKATTNAPLVETDRVQEPFGFAEVVGAFSFAYGVWWRALTAGVFVGVCWCEVLVLGVASRGSGGA